MRLKSRLEHYEYFHPRFLYEVVDSPEESKDTALRTKTLPMEFPLTKDDKNDIIKFMLHFDSRPKLLSLSAPQINISKRFFVFEVPMGRGVVQPFPKTFWINPTYKYIREDEEEKYEMCLSTNMPAPVKRYKRIFYRAYDLEKQKKVEGEAQGVTARLIQHHVDHLNGVMIHDLVPRDKLITYEKYRQLKKEAWGGKGWMDCIDEMVQEMKDLRSYYPQLTKTKKMTPKYKNKNKKKK